MNIFNGICDQPDALQILCELWDQDWPAGKTPSSLFRDTTTRELDAFYQDRRNTFKETVKSVWSALICSSNILEPLIYGVTDTGRITQLRALCIHSEPVKTLTSDGIGRLG